MKVSTWVLVGCGSAATVAALAWAFTPRPVEVEVATVTQGPFQATIDEDGKARLRDRYVVSAPLAGRLMRMSLREGDRVEAGDVVAVLLPALPPMLDERSLREQQARLAAAESQVGSAKARVEAARLALQKARGDAARTSQLAGQGFVSLTKLDADRLAAEVAQKDLDAATEARHVADHESQQARFALMALRDSGPARPRAFPLRSPVAGQVLRVPQPSEGMVALGAPLLELGDTRKLEVVAELLTGDALRVRAGTPVLIERWGGSGALHGEVRLVEPSAFTKVSALGVEEQRVKVLVDITSPPALWTGMGDGYRVGVRIVDLAIGSATQVPVSAVFPTPAREGQSGGFGVFRIDEGRARMVPVDVGARNGSHAWLRGGPVPGDTVIVYPPPAVKDGGRVSPRKV